MIFLNHISVCNEIIGVEPSRKIYKEEERDAETAFIARQIQEELEDAEAENSLPEGERTRKETNCRNMLNEIDINDFLRIQRNQSRTNETTNQMNRDSSHDNGHKEQEGNPNKSDVEFEYVTSHDNLLYKVNEGKVIPKLVGYKIESEEEEDSDRAISPLYEDSDRPSSSFYEEVVIDEWPQVKEEVNQESVQENDQQTPPRSFVFEETVRTTPVKERVGLKNSEKREAQKTKSAKDRLGTKLSDFTSRNQEPDNHVSIHDRLRERQRNVLDRIQPVPGEDHSSQSTSIRS